MKSNGATEARPSWFSRNSGALFAGGFGLVFAIAGLLSRRGRRAGGGIAGEYRGQPVGARALLEARIASDAAAVMRDFVAFRRREGAGPHDRFRV
jgi:hypothetical protein